MPWSVYLLRCGDGSLYTGISKDVERRVLQHNAGRGAKYTRAHLPVTLVWSARAKSEGAAKSREAKIKQMTKGQKEDLLKR